MSANGQTPDPVDAATSELLGGGGAGGGDGAAGAGRGGGGEGTPGAGRNGGVVASGGLPGSRENDDDDAGPFTLLVPLLEEWRHLLVAEVLARLDPTDFAMLARVGKPWLALVLANNLPCAGKRGAVPLKLADFIGSVQMLAWAKVGQCKFPVSNPMLKVPLDTALDILI
jgi:hypothetical protein